MRRITVRGIIVKDGKLFAQKLKSRDGGTKNYWCTPGGGLEDGESLYDGLTREMIEETGVKPKIGRLLYIQQYAENGKEYLEFFFEITNVSDYETIDLSATSHGTIEIAENMFINSSKENFLPKFLQSVDCSIDGELQIISYL